MGIKTVSDLALTADAIAYNRVPKVTWDFWVVKLLAVTVGETGADFLAQNMGLGLAQTTILMSAILSVILIFQFAQKKYIPLAYWLAVIFLSIVGTLITDYMVDDLGVTLVMSTFVFSAALMATFATWYAMEKTLSIHTIFTNRREAFYWLAILFTFALGTAAGDLLAEGLGLGYLPSALVYAVIISIIGVCYWLQKLNGILAFWLAYILTRPMGASFGDLFSQPKGAGGMGFGTTITSVIFFVAIAATLIYMTKNHNDEKLIKAGNR
ncbi:MAG: COG4705 family protein [Rhodomicrobiaceae bacterium]